MLTKLKTYEGVPVGGSNFEDFLNYVRSFLGANFGFSTNVLTNEGGYFADDDFNYYSKGTLGGPEEAYFFTPTDAVGVGNLFGKKDNEHFRFEVISAETDDPQVTSWELLPTITTTSDGAFTYENNNFSEKMLPYRPLKVSPGGYSQGYDEVRFNGIPQSDFANSFSVSGSFNTQELVISKLNLGAEYPTPVLNNRYDGAFTDSVGITKTDLKDDYNNRLFFPYTNFNIDFGGHIILYRNAADTHYVYIPQDTSSGDAVKSGYYKVVDYSRGEIELNISPSQAELLLETDDGFTSDTVPFKVFSLEQLQEEPDADITNYHTRYGEIYDGNDANVLLLEYLFDGQTHIVREIAADNYVSSEGSIILQDGSQRYTDGVVLAFSYDANVNKQKLVDVQANRYQPDTIQLYYHTGMIADLVSDNTNNIRVFVEQNPSSWYNRSVLDAEYYPVSRADSTYISYITSIEAQSNIFTTSQTTSNPNVSFSIVDTIALSGLSDINGPASVNDVLLYNGSTWDTYPTSITAASDSLIRRDANGRAHIGTPTESTHIVNLEYMNTAIAVGSDLGYIPLARSGGAETDYTLETNRRIIYSSAIAGPTVDSVGDVSNTINPLFLSTVDYATTSVNTHNDGTQAHGATSDATADRIIIRDSAGRAKVVSPADASDIANRDYVDTSVGTTSSNLTTHMNDVDPHGATPSILGNRIILRDISGRAQVASPSAVGDIATKGYVDNLGASYGGSWASVGDSLYLAWTETSGVGDNSGVTIFGSALPSGSYSLLNYWVSAQASSAGKSSQIATRQGSAGVNAGRQPYMAIMVHFIVGGSAWGARCHWLIRKL